MLVIQESERWKQEAHQKSEVSMGYAARSRSARQAYVVKPHVKKIKVSSGQVKKITEDYHTVTHIN